MNTDEITALRAQLAEANERAKTAERTMRKRDEETFGEAVSRLRLAWTERDTARAQLETARGLLAGAVAQLRIEFATYHSGCDESRCELARLLAFLVPVQHAAPVASEAPRCLCVRPETGPCVGACLTVDRWAAACRASHWNEDADLRVWSAYVHDEETPPNDGSELALWRRVARAAIAELGRDDDAGAWLLGWKSEGNPNPMPDAAGTPVEDQVSTPDLQPRAGEGAPAAPKKAGIYLDENGAFAGFTDAPPEALPREPQAARRDPDLLAIYEDLDARGRLTVAGKETLHQLRSAPESTPPKETSRMGDAEWTCSACGCWRILDVAAMTEADNQGPTYLCDNHGCACWEHQSTPPKETP